MVHKSGQKDVVLKQKLLIMPKNTGWTFAKNKPEMMVMNGGSLSMLPGDGTNFCFESAWFFGFVIHTYVMYVKAISYKFDLANP